LLNRPGFDDPDVPNHQRAAWDWVDLGKSKQVEFAHQARKLSTPQAIIVIRSISISRTRKFLTYRFQKSYAFRVLLLITGCSGGGRIGLAPSAKTFDSLSSTAARTAMCVQLEGPGCEHSSQHQQP